MKYNTFSAALAVIFLLAGCATVTRGSEDVLVVNATPADSTVRLSTGATCQGGQCSFRLPRRSNLQVTVSRDRCETQVVNITHRTADAGAMGMAGNVLVGGLIGIGVDAATGASQDLVPNPVNVTLACRR
jgi:hypothetical protein